MTFEEFQATKRASDDLAELAPLLSLDEEDLRGPGLIYLGFLIIEKETKNWPRHSVELNRYQLVICNTVMVDTNLEKLERKLFEFAVSEGFDLERPAVSAGPMTG